MNFGNGYNEPCSMEFFCGFNSQGAPYSASSFKKRHKILLVNHIQENIEDWWGDVYEDDDEDVAGNERVREVTTTPWFCQLNGPERDIWHKYLTSINFKVAYEWFNPNYSYDTKNAMYYLPEMTKDEWREQVVVMKKSLE